MAGERIMIVEDDEDLQTLYGLYLQGESYQISRARNGKEALNVFDKESPELIVLDMIMPEMDGEQFYHELCVERKITNVPIIIASVNEKLSPKLFEIGNVVRTLKKPFAVETLINEIEAALKQQAS